MKQSELAPFTETYRLHAEHAARQFKLCFCMWCQAYRKVMGWTLIEDDTEVNHNGK